MNADPRTLDPKNLSILADRLAAREQITGPRVGDWLRRLDGSESRITYVWDFDGEGAHVQDGGTVCGRFYMQPTGHLSYSGGLNPGLPGSVLELTEETKDGWVWFFDRDWHAANCGVDFKITERVWRQVA